jgi:hypothetical protein
MFGNNLGTYVWGIHHGKGFSLRHGAIEASWQWLCAETLGQKRELAHHKAYNERF